MRGRNQNDEEIKLSQRSDNTENAKFQSDDEAISEQEEEVEIQRFSAIKRKRENEAKAQQEKSSEVESIGRKVIKIGKPTKIIRNNMKEMQEKAFLDRIKDYAKKDKK